MHTFILTTLTLALCHFTNASPIRLRRRQASNSTIEWTSCGEETPASLQCAEFQVPMDWADPAGQQITLGISRVLATDNSTRIGSLIFNPGGPGGAATPVCYAQATSQSVFGQSVAAHFDIICPDPRGVATSTPVRCDPDLWNERQTLFPTDNATYNQMVDKYEAFGQSCLDLSGDIVKFVDTVSVARDFEAIRIALGEEKLNYLGGSYGSQIGTTYAELYPENIRAMALDGILDHTASKTYFLVTETQTYEDELDRFFAWCNTNQTCPLQGQNVSQIFDDLVSQADQTPIAAPRCLPTSNDTLAGTCMSNVTGEDIRFNTQNLLLVKEQLPGFSRSWSVLGTALREAMNNDASLLSSPMATSENSTIWQGLAVGCLDWQRSTNFADLVYKQQLTESTSPHTRGACQSYTYESQCAGWPVAIANPQKPLNETAMASTPPILLVNSNHDPSTSYTWANSIKEQIPNGVLLTRNGDGHTSYFLKGEAAAAIDAYLVDGTLPADNAVVQS